MFTKRTMNYDLRRRFLKQSKLMASREVKDARHWMYEVAQESDRSKPVRLDVQIPPEMDDHIQAAMAEGGWTSKAKFVRECIHRTLHGESAEDPIVAGLHRELDAVREDEFNKFLHLYKQGIPCQLAQAAE